jgi:bifunctional polynucleotide phosphatase/kinase
MNSFSIYSTDSIDHLLIWNKHHLGTKKLLALDLDHTFIKPKSGAIFSKNADDWCLIYPDSLHYITKYMHDGFSIIFMTNQKGLNTVDKLEEFKHKWLQVVSYLHETTPELDTSKWVLLASLNTDIYRKPAPGMWDFSITELNSGHAWDLKHSLFVGDAAGRPKDFKPTDIMMAMNVGVYFMVPEVFFGIESGNKQLEAYSLIKAIKKNKKYFNAERFLDSYKKLVMPDLTAVKATHLVIMVGAQASGKSTFCRKYLREYIHMSNDTFSGTSTAFKKELEAQLKAGKRVVIDNTNPTVDSRSKWLKIAAKCGVTCAVVYMGTTDDRLSVEHMLKLRDILGIQHVPIIALRTFYKKLEKPTMEEGFDTLVKIPLELDVAEESKKHDIPLDAFSWWLD